MVRPTPADQKIPEKVVVIHVIEALRDFLGTVIKPS